MKKRSKALTSLKRMADLTRRIVAVPKAEVAEAEKKWKVERRGPIKKR